MRRRNWVSAVALGSAAAAAGTWAVARCLPRAPQSAQLEIVSVTVDGQAQDLARYTTLRARLDARATSLDPPPGASLVVFGCDSNHAYVEGFDALVDRDR
jgi:hypothetical protein